MAHDGSGWLLPLERTVASAPLLSWAQVATVALPLAWAALLALTLLGALPAGAHPGADAAAIGLLVAWVVLQLLRKVWWGAGPDATDADAVRAGSPRRIVLTSERLLLLGRSDVSIPLASVAAAEVDGRRLHLGFADGSSVHLGHVVASALDLEDLVAAVERRRHLLGGGSPGRVRQGP